jgi:hypothetical protein
MAQIPLGYDTATDSFVNFSGQVAWSFEVNNNFARILLGQIRHAIQVYRFDNSGSFPSASISSEIAVYLPSFGMPPVPVGANAGSSAVAIEAVPLGGMTVGGTEGWRYSTASGEFRINDTTYFWY